MHAFKEDMTESEGRILCISLSPSFIFYFVINAERNIIGSFPEKHVIILNGVKNRLRVKYLAYSDASISPDYDA